MGNYCDIIPKVKDNQGREVESKLFSDLLDFFDNDRALTKKHYFGAVHPTFVSSVASDENVIFDENGEITLHSLIKVANLDPQNIKLIKKLNKDIKSGVYSYSEGLQKARAFNKTEYGDRYLATLVPEGKGKYRLKVVEKTAESITAFEEVLKEQETMTMIIDELNNQGVRVDFNDSKEYDGRFSTATATKTADGMYTLIQISRGAKDIKATLMEEAAHFAIAALHNTTPVKRLLEMCDNPDTVRRLGLYTKDEVKMGLDGNVYETAGRILARAFAEKNLYGFGGFVNRVKNFVFNLFSKIAPDSFLSKRAEINNLANQIADEFSYGNVSVETALENPITLFSGRVGSTPITTLIKIQEAVTVLSNEVYNADTNLYHLLKDSDAYNQLSIEDVASVSVRRAAQLSQLMVETLLNSISGHIAEIENLDANRSTMSEEEYKMQRRKQVYLLSSFTDSLITMKDSLIALGKEDPELNNYLITSTLSGKKGISDIINFCGDEVLQMIREVAAEFYTGLIGSDRIVMDGKIKKVIAKVGKKGKTTSLFVLESGREVTAEQLIKYVSGDSSGNNIISLFRSLFQAPHKLSDTPLSYLKMYVRNEDVIIQRRIASEFEPDMNELERIVRDAGFKNMHDLKECLEEYEDEDGNIRRDNFRTPYRYAKYEEVRRGIIKDIREECKKYINDNPDEFPDSRSRIRYINRAIRESEDLMLFEEESWITEPDGTKHLNPDYRGGIYRDTEYEGWLAEASVNPNSKAAKKIRAIEALREYKESVDAILEKPGGGVYGVSYRIPQISTKNTLFREVSYAVKKQMYPSGADFALGTEDVGVYKDALEEVEDVFLKLPLYGIRKTNNPSTDLLTSLKLYTVMAVRFSELNKGLFTLMLTGKALNQRESSRSGAKIANESATEVEATVYKHLFGDSDPYGKRSDTEKRIRKAADVYFLAQTLLGNVFSFAKNFISSNYTVLTNSTVSNYYGLLNYTRAVLEKAFTGLTIKPLKKVAKWVGFNTLEKDKLILHHINGTFNDTIAWNKYKPKVWLKYIFYQAPMKLYGKGDEFAQEAAYLASLNHFHGYEFSKIPKKSLLSARGSYIYHIERTLSKKLSRARLKNIYKFSKTDEYGNKSTGVYISNSFLKKKEDVGYYVVLKSFLEDLETAIEENNALMESGDPDAVFRVVSDFFNTSNLYTSNIMMALNAKEIPYQDEDTGMFTTTLEELRDNIKETIGSMVWTEGDLVNISNGLISELVEVQGTYFTGLRTKIQTDASMEGTAMFFGYGIGAANKYLNSNFNTLTGKYEASMWDAFRFSIMKEFKGVVKDETASEFELRRKSVLEFLTIAALNCPGLELFTRNKMAREVLMQAGYDEHIIKRMHTLGNGVLWWFLFRTIARLFANKNNEKLADNLKTEKYKKGSYQGYDLDLLEYTMLDRLAAGLGAKKSMLFDLICPPPDEATIRENAIKGLENTFGKYNGMTLAIINSPEFKEDARAALEKFSYMLQDYATMLEENPDSDPIEVFKEVAKSYGISNKAVNDMLTVDFPYSKKKHNHGIPIKQKGGGNSILSYSQFLDAYGFEDTPKNKDFYEFCLNPDNGARHFVYERYFLSNPEDARIIGNKVLANVYNSIGYDKDSPEYKLCGILYYLLASGADEAGSMLLPHKNIEDFVSGVTFIPKNFNMMLSDTKDLVNMFTDDKSYEGDALTSAVTKIFSDFVLGKVGMESDAYGNWSTPDNFDEMSSGEQALKGGATFKDHYVRYNQKKNFEEVRR